MPWSKSWRTSSSTAPTSPAVHPDRADPRTPPRALGQPGRRVERARRGEPRAAGRARGPPHAADDPAEAAAAGRRVGLGARPGDGLDVRRAVDHGSAVTGQPGDQPVQVAVPAQAGPADVVRRLRRADLPGRVEAGLGLPVTTTTLAPAWSGPSDDTEVVLPVDHSFSFSTGQAADFKALAERLHGVRAEGGDRPPVTGHHPARRRHPRGRYRTGPRDGGRGSAGGAPRR